MRYLLILKTDKIAEKFIHLETSVQKSTFLHFIGFPVECMVEYLKPRIIQYVLQRVKQGLLIG